MKKKIIQIDREDWESMTEYKKTPIKKEYEEFLKKKEKMKLLKGNNF